MPPSTPPTSQELHCRTPCLSCHLCSSWRRCVRRRHGCWTRLLSLLLCRCVRCSTISPWSSAWGGRALRRSCTTQCLHRTRCLLAGTTLARACGAGAGHREQACEGRGAPPKSAGVPSTHSAGALSQLEPQLSPQLQNMMAQEEEAGRSGASYASLRGQLTSRVDAQVRLTRHPVHSCPGHAAPPLCRRSTPSARQPWTTF